MKHDTQCPLFLICPVFQFLNGNICYKLGFPPLILASDSSSDLGFNFGCELNTLETNCSKS